MTTLIKQSSVVVHIPFLMVLASDHVTGATGLVPVVTLSKNGAAFGAAAGAITEIGSGWYKLAANATDSNTLGVLALHAAVATADPTDFIAGEIVAFDPQDTVRLGLTALPNAVAGATGGLDPAVIRGGTLQSGTAPNLAILDAGASAQASIYAGDIIKIVSGTGAGQTAVVLTYVGLLKQVAVAPDWVIVPDNTSVFELISGRTVLEAWRQLQPLALSSGRVQTTVGALSTAALAAIAMAIRSPVN